MKIKVEEQKTLVRDTRSNAILNTDVESLNRHRAQRRVLESKDNLINSMDERIKALEELVSSLVEKKIRGTK